MTDITIALLYPSLLGTYGDGGNALVLAQRLRWRGITAEVLSVDIDDPLPTAADAYVLGGGEDAAQTLAVSRLSSGGLRSAASNGALVFAVCAGFQILGETFLDGHGVVFPGLGLIDCVTDRLEGPRAVGELLVDSPIGTLTGYENHGGRTTLGPDAAALGTVEVGVGNGAATHDGAIQGSVVATYLHGPVLARNPQLADWLLTRLLGRALPPLEDDAASQDLHDERVAAVRGASTRLAPWRRNRQWRPPARS